MTPLIKKFELEPGESPTSTQLARCWKGYTWLDWYLTSLPRWTLFNRCIVRSIRPLIKIASDIYEAIDYGCVTVLVALVLLAAFDTSITQSLPRGLNTRLASTGRQSAGSSLISTGRKSEMLYQQPGPPPWVTLASLEVRASVHCYFICTLIQSAS